jgi:hypothetical protein
MSSFCITKEVIFEMYGWKLDLHSHNDFHIQYAHKRMDLNMYFDDVFLVNKMPYAII